MNKPRRVKVSKFPIKLDLGCKENTKPGFIGLDARDFGQEVLWDINDGLPFHDNSVEEVYAYHFFEHLTASEINTVVWEIKRVCMDGAKVEIYVPMGGTEAGYDVSHYSQWNKDRFYGVFGSVKDEIVSFDDDNGNLHCVIKVKKHESYV